MSTHLTCASPYLRNQVNNAIPYAYYNGRKLKGFPVKIMTDVNDYKMIEEILAESTLGFKSKRELMEFQSRCGMVFANYGFVEITFTGNFKKNEIKKIVNTLNREFKKRKKQQFREEQRRLKQEERERERKLRQEQKERERKLRQEQKERERKLRQEQKEREKIINQKTKKLLKEQAEMKKQITELFDELDKIESNHQEISNISKFTISSNLTDISLINKVLDETYLGFSSKNDLEAFQNIGQILFKKSSDGTYDIIFEGDYDEEEALVYVNNLVDEYTSLVQEQIYLKLLKKIDEENLSLESEIVDNQDSIVLTINI